MARLAESPADSEGKEETSAGMELVVVMEAVVMVGEKEGATEGATEEAMAEAMAEATVVGVVWV